MTDKILYQTSVIALYDLEIHIKVAQKNVQKLTRLGQGWTAHFVQQYMPSHEVDFLRSHNGN